jgi:hypothetical protein
VAVAAGTATAVSNRVSRRQGGRWAQKDQQAQQDQQAQEEQQPAEDAEQAPAAEPAADPMDARLAQLQQLGELKAQGVLTESEFAAQKARILGS